LPSAQESQAQSWPQMIIAVWFAVKGVILSGLLYLRRRKRLKT
jgi:hypothetical protein